MIDFLIKIPLDLVLSKDAATKNYHILPFPGEQEKPGPASKQAQIFFPGQTQYQEITLETGGRLIIIGDFILPPGTAPAGIITGELGDNIRNMNGFFYGIEIKNNSISVFTGMFNILPIFYYQGAQNLWIASKTHFITRMTDINPRINKRFILEQKLFNYPFFNDTPYLEIALLPANSYIQYQQGKVNIIQHTNIEDYFTTSPKPWKNSIESITALFLERVQDYFPDEPFYLSLTSGFDGRTLTACAKKYQKKFAAYAFGAHGTADLEIPKEQAAKLDIDFEPIYLDEQYAKNAFLTDGKELLDLTSGFSNYLQVHFLYAARYLSAKTSCVINGMFGSELFRALHISGQVTSRALVDFFMYDTGDEWIKKITNAPVLRYLEMSQFKSEMEEVITRLNNYRQGLNKSLDTNHHFYKFIFEEAFRKYFGSQIISQLPYVNCRSPFLDFAFIRELLQTRLAGANNAFFTHNPLKRFKGQLFYAKAIEKTYQPLLFMKTGKGYRPADLLHHWGLLHIAYVYFSKRLKRKFEPPELDNLQIVSGIHAHRELFQSIPIEPGLFNKDLMKKLTDSGEWLTDRDKYIETLSTNLYLHEKQ